MQPFIELRLHATAAPDAVGRALGDACANARLVHVRGTPRSSNMKSFWDEAIGAFGTKVSVDEDPDTGVATGAGWSSVEFDPLRSNRFRHSSTAQPLHTDGSYLPDPPSIVFLICEKQARSGGATLFLDGPALESTLERERPDLLRRLLEVPIIFGKGGSEVETMIISPSARGSHLTWNYFAASEKNTADAAALCRHFRDFLQHLTSRQLPRALRLAPGEAVIFRDNALLHGRERFAATEAGDRLLLKGGLRL